MVRARRTKAGSRWAGLAMEVFCALLVFSDCERESSQASRKANQQSGAATPATPKIELPTADQRLCTAVVLLVDGSGSMAQEVRARDGALLPKHVIARQAVDRIVEYTTRWRLAHKDRVLQLGIYRFSSGVHELLPISEFDPSTARAAVAELGRVGGGTAIGEALKAGFRALYASGCVRKYLICITDGENTVGPRPDRIARQLYRQTGGDVEIHFVAFDTAAARFAFLREANGMVVEAADGKQLEARLSAIYEKRILAEAMAESDEP